MVNKSRSVKVFLKMERSKVNSKIREGNIFSELDFSFALVTCIRLTMLLEYLHNAVTNVKLLPEATFSKFEVWKFVSKTFCHRQE